MRVILLGFFCVSYSFHWKLLTVLWYLVVKINCEFLLLNDMFDLQAINDLLTY